MFRASTTNRFEYIVFPRVEQRRSAVNLAPAGPVASLREFGGALLSDEEVNLVTWMLSKAGLDARDYRAETLQRRLPACLRAIRADSPAHARELLEANSSEIPAALSALLVGVTSFFRDAPVFEHLKSEIERQQSEGKRGFDVWSIGCSEGAELYSMGILLAELNGLSESCVLGTDCRADAIEIARQGTYDLSHLRQVPPELHGKYFERNGKCCRVSELIRQAVRWRVASILTECEPGLWDIILFRNTALYLQAATVQSLWSKLENALKPGGLLVLGRAERPTGAHRLRAIGPCIYRRQPR